MTAFRFQYWQSMNTVLKRTFFDIIKLFSIYFSFFGWNAFFFHENVIYFENKIRNIRKYTTCER